MSRRIIKSFFSSSKIKIVIIAFAAIFCTAFTIAVVIFFNQLYRPGNSHAANVIASPSSTIPITNGTVFAIAKDGNGILYIGGDFTTVGGTTRNRLAAIDATGAVTSWNPNVGNGQVSTISISGSTVYVGGTFTSVGGSTRNRIAAIDTSGTLSSWDPNADAQVLAVLASGTTIYVGGDFTSIGGQARNYIAALDANTNSNNATAWNPGAGNSVAALAKNGTTLYVGGFFTTIGGADRNKIAALDTTTDTNNATAWNPIANSTVYALALNGTTLYAGGSFTSIGGQSRDRIAALDTTTNTNNATSWNPGANSQVLALAVSVTTVYAGGFFTSIGGQSRNRIAALDSTVNTSNATIWNPDADAAVRAILATTYPPVYVGGAFTTIGGSARQGLAVFELPTVSLSNSPSAVSENGGVATITATLSGAISDDVTVNVSYSGTATNGTNYNRSSSAITILAGTTTSTISLTGVNAGIYHTPDLTIATTINSVTNGIASSTASTVTTTLTNVNAAPPTTPTSTSNITTSSIKYSWTSSGGPETFFSLDSSTDGTNFSQVATTTTSTVEYNFNQLSTNTLYWFRVAASTATYATSSYTTSSPVFTLAAIPNAPTSVTSTAPTTLTVTIDATTLNGNPQTASTTYLVKDTGPTIPTYLQTNGTWTTTITPLTYVQLGSGAATTTTGLNANTLHTISVSAINGNGVATSYGATLSSYTLASVPSSVTISVTDANTASVSWSGDGSTYAISGSRSSGWIDSLSFSFSNLDCDTSYLFQVRAKNADNIETTKSNPVSIQTGACGGGWASWRILPPPEIPSLTEPASSTPSDFKPPPEKPLEPNENISLGIGKSLVILIGDTAHILKVERAAQKSITFTLHSDPITVTLGLNQSQDLDTDGNGTIDTRATYLGFSNGEAQIKLTSLTQKLPVDAELKKSPPKTEVQKNLLDFNPEIKNYPPVFKRQLSLGMIGNDVRTLQIFLNSHGYLVTKNGKGSPGYETEVFGLATKKALTAFQEDNANAILTPLGLTKGTGILGNLTIKVITSIH